MKVFVYAIYAIAVITYIVLSIFAVNHAFRYAYISPRIKTVAWIFMLVSVVLLAASFYFLLKINF